MKNNTPKGLLARLDALSAAAAADREIAARLSSDEPVLDVVVVEPRRGHNTTVAGAFARQPRAKGHELRWKAQPWIRTA